MLALGPKALHWLSATQKCKCFFFSIMQGVTVLVLVFMWCSQTVHTQEGQWIANYIPLVTTKVWGSGQVKGSKVGWPKGHWNTCNHMHKNTNAVLCKYTSSCLSVSKQSEEQLSHKLRKNEWQNCDCNLKQLLSVSDSVATSTTLPDGWTWFYWPLFFVKEGGGIG